MKTNGHTINSNGNKKNFERFFSAPMKRIAPNEIRKAVDKQLLYPDIIPLGNGEVHTGLFPFEDVVSIKSRTPKSEFVSDSEIDNEASRTIECKIDYVKMFNYQPFTFSHGLPSLIQRSKELLLSELKFDDEEKFWASRSCCISGGSTDGMAKFCTLVGNPGDVMFCSKFTYPGMVAAVTPTSIVLQDIECDDDDIIPEELEKACVELLESGRGLPKALYIIPNGSNPSGVTISLERRKALYEICCKYDLLILEDDPYYFIRLGDDAPKHKTFLELDEEFIDGRVIRLDTWSKLIAPGVRMGLVTGPKEYIQKYGVLSQVTNWSLSGFSQPILEGILTNWGSDGFKKHVENLCKIYTARRNTMMKALEKHVSKDKIEYTIPRHGMFLWLKVKGCSDTRDLADRLSENGLGLMPGGVFCPTPNTVANAFRVSFSVGSSDQLVRAAEIIGKVLSA